MPSLDFSHAWPWLQALIAAAAVVAFFAGAIKLVPPAWKVVSRFVTTINALADLPEELKNESAFRTEVKSTLEAQNVQLGVLKHEVMPNNGGSLRDAIDRVKDKVDEHGEILSDVQSKLANDDRRISNLQSRDELGRFVKEDK